jgi:hypothetical protein
MDKLIEAVKLLKEADREFNKNDLTLVWSLRIEQHIDLLTPMLAGSLEKADIPETRLQSAVRAFVSNRCDFLHEATLSIQEAHNAFMSFLTTINEEPDSDESFSQHRFARCMRCEYKDRIDEEVTDVNGKPARCLIGISLKEKEA